MKAHYIERGKDRIATHSFVVHTNAQPVAQERIEDTIFGDSHFKTNERPKPELVVHAG